MVRRSASPERETSEGHVARIRSQRVAAASRRRALAIAALPAAIPGVIALVACLVLVAVWAGILAGLVVWVGCATAIWCTAGKRVLRAIGGSPARDGELVRVENLVEGLCATMGLSVPRLWLLEEPSPNAMALSLPRSEAVLVLTTGLVSGLDPIEIEGVLAHELTHVKRKEALSATLAASVMLILAPLVGDRAGDMVHAIAGRGREMRSDWEAVGVTRYPPGLRSALMRMADLDPEASGTPASGEGPARLGRGLYVTRWLWTAPVGVARAGEELIGELDAPGVRIDALGEW